MIPCACHAEHPCRRVVLTGGPGAGKTAVLELIRQSFCKHLDLVPEAAGIVFGGGFPRRTDVAARRSAQRAIFHVQHELEAIAAPGAAITLCDRGTIDSVAYWPGPGEPWSEVGTTLAAELARYATVIHLRVPAANNGYNHRNPLRIETAEEARAIDDRIAQAWATHPRRFEVPATADFMEKARRAFEILAGELPPCCTPPGIT